MNVFLTHPTGNRNVRAIVETLSSRDELVQYGTTLAFDADTLWLKALPASIRQELLRRTYTIPPEKIATHAYRELARMLFNKAGMASLVAHEKGWACVDQVYQDFDRAMAKKLYVLSKKQQVNAVYAYEDGALETFKTAKQLGIKCIYDLPIAYWETGRKLMQEEAERLPEWAQTLGGGISDSEAKLERKTQELELADVVVGPGQFVLDSIPQWAHTKKIIMAPFGSPISHLPDLYTKKDPAKPLRILFVGSMGQRKGLGDLFKAVAAFSDTEVELVVLGSLLAPMAFYKSQLDTFTYETGRPHDKVLELMRSCDVFCLPSIVEGRALVMQEAMSQGLPIIITENTGGSDLVIEGETGFIVPIRSPESIKEKISWFLQHRLVIPQMGEQARKHAAGYTWDNYGNTVVDGIASIISNR